MADCSNIFTFMEEWERRRKADLLPDGTEIWESAEKLYHTKDLSMDVYVLQRWSDKHPIQTRKEKFIQMCRENGFECPQNDYCCYHYPYCVEIKKGEDNSCEMCEAYWNSPAE